jgi:hypothetical protein
MPKELICRRCHKAVVVNAETYDTFEGMHWVCFHLEYEHGRYDPDQPCDDPGCFWRKGAPSQNEGKPK